MLWLATPHLLLGKDLGGWRGLVPTATCGTVVTVGLRLLSLLLLPRWLCLVGDPFGAIGTSIALVVQLLATGWVVVAAFGAVYWERIADQDTVIKDKNSTAEPPSRRRTVRLTGGRTTMVDDSDHQMQQPRRQRPRRLLQAFSSPDGYSLVRSPSLIVTTYTLSALTTAAWALHAGPVRSDRHHLGDPAGLPGTPPPPRDHHLPSRHLSAAIAVVNASSSSPAHRQLAPWPSSAACSMWPPRSSPATWSPTHVDTQTILGAIAAYLMIGMSFAFAYLALGALQAGPFFGSQGEGNFSQDLFFSFTST